MSSRFDRVRPRTPELREAEELAGLGAVDADGKRALFSDGVPDSPPGFGSVSVECSACGVETALTVGQWVRAAVPSLHLPLLKRRYPSFMRCPACGRRTWLHPHFHV